MELGKWRGTLRASQVSPVGDTRVIQQLTIHSAHRRGDWEAWGYRPWGEGFCPRLHMRLPAPVAAEVGVPTYLNGQDPDGQGSSQVDIGLEGIEDDCVAALRGKGQR